MKLTKELLKEMILKEMKNLTPAQIEQEVRKHIMQIGDPDGVKNIAFVTAHEPPEGGKNFEWDNDEMQFHLKSMLKRRGYKEFYPIIGNYGGQLEGSLMVVERDQSQSEFLDQMVSIGKQFNQDAVIVGTKQESMQTDPSQSGPAYHMDFEMINLHPTKTGVPNMDFRQQSTYDERDQVQYGPAVQSRATDFSQAGNFKFVIPFFSSAPADQNKFRANVRNVGE
tara:strand:- start:204 stop:875 length:672 start_codon:yes stop_codon:yes gene_type:complete